MVQTVRLVSQYIACVLRPYTCLKRCMHGSDNVSITFLLRPYLKVNYGSLRFLAMWNCLNLNLDDLSFDQSV